MFYLPGQTSPTDFRADDVGNLAPPSSDAISSSSFCTDFRVDLLRTVLYERQSVLDNLLGPRFLEGDTVTDAVAVAVAKDCSDELQELRRISALTTRDEKAMYPHLVSVDTL